MRWERLGDIKTGLAYDRVKEKDRVEQERSGKMHKTGFR
jgi:hypothetical protein